MATLGLQVTKLFFVARLAILLSAAFDVAISTNHDYSRLCSCDEASISRRGFPDGFIFGSASSAYQIEGGYKENGKGSTMWDQYTHSYPDKIDDHSNGNVAVDSYQHYKEDVQCLKYMGADAYKFSISWARILPRGKVKQGVNQDGIEYYSNLINQLLENGIEPWVTLLHLDTPQALEEAYGGFLSSQIVTDFKEFADLLFREYGDRVKKWITINEPWGLSVLGYARGVFAPGRCSQIIHKTCLPGNSSTEPYIVNHNQLLAHAAVVKLYRSKYQNHQKGSIGITVNSFWFVPYNSSPENQDAKYRALDFMLGWSMEPLTFGRYPESMRQRVGSRLPEFTEEEADMVKGSFDFIGLNYYSTYYALNIGYSDTLGYLTDSGVMNTGVKDGIPIGEKGWINSWYYAYPKGLHEILKYIKQTYNDPLIYITENGYGDGRNDSIPITEALQDNKRKKYFLEHLCCLREAIREDGVTVKGYFAWSLMDSFSWRAGYLVRFGLNYIDFNDPSFRRYPKHSAHWFRSILALGSEKAKSSSIVDQ